VKEHNNPINNLGSIVTQFAPRYMPASPPPGVQGYSTMLPSFVGWPSMAASVTLRHRQAGLLVSNSGNIGVITDVLNQTFKTCSQRPDVLALIYAVGPWVSALDGYHAEMEEQKIDRMAADLSALRCTFSAISYVRGGAPDHPPMLIVPDNRDDLVQLGTQLAYGRVFEMARN
jgi:hypothetical protein